METALPAADHGRIPQRSPIPELQVCNQLCAHPEGTSGSEMTHGELLLSNPQLSRVVYFSQGRNWLSEAGSASNPSLLLQSSEDLNLQRPAAR